MLPALDEKRMEKKAISYEDLSEHSSSKFNTETTIELESLTLSPANNCRKSTEVIEKGIIFEKKN